MQEQKPYIFASKSKGFVNPFDSAVHGQMTLEQMQQVLADQALSNEMKKELQSLHNLANEFCISILSGLTLNPDTQQITVGLFSIGKIRHVISLPYDTLESIDKVKTEIVTIWADNSMAMGDKFQTLNMTNLLAAASHELGLGVYDINNPKYDAAITQIIEKNTNKAMNRVDAMMAEAEADLLLEYEAGNITKEEYDEIIKSSAELGEAIKKSKENNFKTDGEPKTEAELYDDMSSSEDWKNLI